MYREHLAPKELPREQAIKNINFLAYRLSILDRAIGSSTSPSEQGRLTKQRKRLESVQEVLLSMPHSLDGKENVVKSLNGQMQFLEEAQAGLPNSTVAEIFQNRWQQLDDTQAFLQTSASGTQDRNFQTWQQGQVEIVSPDIDHEAYGQSLDLIRHHALGLVDSDSPESQAWAYFRFNELKSGAYDLAKPTTPGISRDSTKTATYIARLASLENSAAENINLFSDGTPADERDLAENKQIEQTSKKLYLDGCAKLYPEHHAKNHPASRWANICEDIKQKMSRSNKTEIADLVSGFDTTNASSVDVKTHVNELRKLLIDRAEELSYGGEEKFFQNKSDQGSYESNKKLVSFLNEQAYRLQLLGDNCQVENHSESRERCLEMLLQNGGIRVNTSLDAESGAGFKTKENRMNYSTEIKSGMFKGNVIGKKEIKENEKNPENILAAHDVIEIAGFVPEQRAVYKTIPGKWGLTGKTPDQRVVDHWDAVSHAEMVKDGQAEPLVWFVYKAETSSAMAQKYGDEQVDWHDYTNRPGQRLCVDIALPRSVAEKLSQAIAQDPGLVRVIAETMVKKVAIPDRPQRWEQPLAGIKDSQFRPPYERWKNVNGGRIYIEPLDAPAGWNDEYYRQVAA